MSVIIATCSFKSQLDKMDAFSCRADRSHSIDPKLDLLSEQMLRTIKYFEQKRKFSSLAEFSSFLNECELLVTESENNNANLSSQISKLLQQIADARLASFLLNFQSKMLGGYLKAALHKYPSLNKLHHTTEHMIVQFIRDLVNRSKFPLAALHSLGFAESRVYEPGMHVSIRFEQTRKAICEGRTGQPDNIGTVLQEGNSRKNSSGDSALDTEATSEGNSSRNSGLSKKNISKTGDFVLHGSPIKGDPSPVGNSSQLKSPKKQQHDLELTENDQDFTNELKGHIKANNRIPDEYRKYFKSFFCDFTISNSMRRWLWQERIGNPIRMNRFVFNNLLVRANYESMSPVTEDIIVEDLLRCCRDAPDPFLAEIMFANVKKVAHLLEVTIVLTIALSSRYSIRARNVVGDLPDPRSVRPRYLRNICTDTEPDSREQFDEEPLYIQRRSSKLRLKSRSTSINSRS